MYIVLEIQDTAVLVNSYDTRNEAENKYHTILAYAAVSSIEKHSAVMLTTDGDFIKSECFEHEVE